MTSSASASDPPTTQPEYHPLRATFCGAASGMCASMYSFPLDTLKVRAQAQAQRHIGMFAYLRAGRLILREEGVRGFYRGVAAPLIGSIVDNSAIFTVYQTALGVIRSNDDTVEVGSSRRRLSSQETDREMFLAGVCGGITSALILTPFELVKCTVQLSHNSPSGQLTVRKALLSIYKAGGVKGFFKGFAPTSLREVPGTATWFFVYHKVLAALKGDSVGVPAAWQSVIAGGSAGVMYWTIAFPADVVKTRVQSGRPEFQKVSVIGALRMLAKAEGVRGLYRGYGITLVRAFPSNAITFTAYENAGRLWDYAAATLDALRHGKRVQPLRHANSIHDHHPDESEQLFEFLCALHA